MSDDAAFAARISERYPEGLTGIFAIGGTRTAYILERNRDREDPGQIDNFTDYAHYTLDQYLRLMDDFFALGGRNLIVPPLSFQAFYERGAAYTQVIMDYTLDLVGERAIAAYRQHDADPYFVGIDTLLHLPDTEPIRQLGVRLQVFQQGWSYSPARRKVFWEIAPIPVYSFRQAQHTMPEDATQSMEAALRESTDMREMYDILFAYYSRAALGAEIPVPHFYVGTNRNGDLKLRSMVPIALLAGGPFRMFFLPYPSPFMTREALRAILDDLAFGGKSLSKSYDYSGSYSSEQAQAEYARVVALASDVGSIAGLKRNRQQ
ncbi:hypothetical protein [Aggregatilinea lenta]|uniref:hypothetical protein n=1 Tax=Aggregatilinea lenta TaxID=913108 RepID=UPI000E5B6264|nr:hypothetical protein [Aggregatilinea lenta]